MAEEMEAKEAMIRSLDKNNDKIESAIHNM